LEGDLGEKGTEIYLKGKTQWKTPSDEVCIFDGTVEKNEL
jgi:hypothetical protein